MADDLAKYPQSKPDFKNGRYGNPWGTWDANHFSVSELFKFYRTENKTQLPSQDVNTVFSAFHPSKVHPSVH